MADECSYRDRPFKKRKVQTTPAPVEARATSQSASAILDIGTLSEDASRKAQRYPNPGYLGSSSHTTFFDHLAGNDQSYASTGIQVLSNGQQGAAGCAVTEEKIVQGASIITQIRTASRPLAWKSLVHAWVDKAINLPVAEPFTLSSADAACSAIIQQGLETEGEPTDYQSAAATSTRLFSQSCQPLTVGLDDTINAFGELFCRELARWETLGVFFTAVSRATIDITQFDGLYVSEQERRALRKLAMRLSDTCLDLALSLDCLNDLQLILQYENFILHSLVDGDQSKFHSVAGLLQSLLHPLGAYTDHTGYYSWRKLGDVISSLFALGYHEQLGHPSITPPFLRELRFVAFSRTYSADKNCSIFLGRPPRMLKRYCPTADLPQIWEEDERFSYRADTRVHGICASLKEDILDLKGEDQVMKMQKARYVSN